MEKLIVKFFGLSWVSFPLVALSGAVLAYFLYTPLEKRFMKKAFGRKQDILQMLDQMFVSVEEKKINRMILLINFGPSIIFFLLLWPNITMGIIVSFIVWLAMSEVPYYYIKHQWEKRNNLLVTQMVDGLTIMSNGIKAGLSVPQSLERVAENLPNPIAQEFTLILSQTKVGRSLEDALIDFGERIPRPDVQMFVTAINILKETGGNLAETFSTIVTVIRERQKVEQKIQAMTTQGMMQGLIISLVPIGIILLLWIMDPTYIQPMFSTTLGIVLLLIVFGLIGVGGIMIKKIVTVKV